jgi:hypothetical protein
LHAALLPEHEIMRERDGGIAEGNGESVVALQVVQDPHSPLLDALALEYLPAHPLQQNHLEQQLVHSKQMHLEYHLVHAKQIHLECTKSLSHHILHHWWTQR